jgi:hypothetical protein
VDADERPITTVDGLFMSLILLTLSGVFLLNAYWEMRDLGMLGKKEKPPAPAPNLRSESELDFMATQTAALSRPIAPASAGVLLPAFTLWWREIVRFYRQKSRVVGVLASPLVFWVVIGSGFGTSFPLRRGQGQQHYMDYFYPGALIMIVLFTSIFTMMSVIEDRKEGFLLSVMVAPVPRSAIVLGKVLGGTTLSAIQGMIFLIFAPFAGVHLNWFRFCWWPSWCFWFRSR